MRYWPGLLIAMVAGSAAFAQTLTPAARVLARAVVHPDDPRLAVRVLKRAAYVGAERFLLYNVADCELHIFVDADAKRRVRRLYWIQFESYLPRVPRARYNYAKIGDRRMTFWGTHIWVNPSFASEDQPVRPGSDTERVRALVKRAGYILPKDMLNVRFVRLLDDPEGTGQGRHELMLIYSEDMGSIGRTSEDLRKDEARWRSEQQPLISRAATAFAMAPR